MHHILAPSGKLRVGVYTGSPQSLMLGATAHDHYGVGFELGRAFAHYIERPFEPVIFEKNGDVLAAAKLGEEKPIKKADHTCDAGRYIVNEVFQYDWRLAA